MTRIAVLASFNMDLVMRADRRPDAGETLQGEFGMFLGGKGFNQAIAAGRLGADVAVVGRVGDDEFGRRFRAALEREGIDAAGVSIDADAGTGVATIIVEASGENAIIQAPQANRNLSADDVARAAGALDGADAALLQLETSMPAALAFAEQARTAGALVILNPAPASPVPDDLLRLADVVVPNAIEARTLCGIAATTIERAFDAADALRARGPRCAVVTLGDRGAVAVDDDTRVHVPAFEVQTIDTVGAGDAFCAALAVALSERRPLRAAVEFATAAGALAVTRPGAEPSIPRRQEVDQLAAKGARA